MEIDWNSFSNAMNEENVVNLFYDQLEFQKYIFAFDEIVFNLPPEVVFEVGKRLHKIILKFGNRDHKHNKKILTIIQNFEDSKGNF